MNLDSILGALHRHRVQYLLIGGMNYLLRHEPVLTYDVDLWVRDTPKNLARCETALGELSAEWGMTDKDWKSVKALAPGWLAKQTLYCLTSPHGSIDVFRAVRGLADWRACRRRAARGKTAAGTAYTGLSDGDMLRSQVALAKTERKTTRIAALRRALKGGTK